jgi:hypothetical protein
LKSSVHLASNDEAGALKVEDITFALAHLQNAWRLRW